MYCSVEFVCVLTGATNPAQSEPGTIRGDYCIEVGRNIIHGSDAPESAEKEIALWFPDGALLPQACSCAQATARTSWHCSTDAARRLHFALRERTARFVSRVVGPRPLMLDSSPCAACTVRLHDEPS